MLAGAGRVGVGPGTCPGVGVVCISVRFDYGERQCHFLAGAVVFLAGAVVPIVLAGKNGLVFQPELESRAGKKGGELVERVVAVLLGTEDRAGGNGYAVG